MARLSEQGIRLSSMSPSFLNSNSTSHTWPFSAVAELIDNASDPGVSAKQIWVDAADEASQPCLMFTDNGSGMTPNKLHKMLSFGFTSKGSAKASMQAVGIYGNGFKSGSMRLGRDALIFTKNGGCQTVGMLSQTYLGTIKAQAVIVPIVPFNQQTMVETEDSEASLAAILQHSIVTSQEQIHAHFDSIPSKKGTKILIWNIRRAKDGKPEFDFETDDSDMRLPEIQVEELKKSLRSSGSLRAEQSVPDIHYSLRAYLSILYLKPRTQIILRGKKILAGLVSKTLVCTEHDVYKPHFSKEKVKVTFGLNRKNEDHYGIMMYHKNRLIKAYEKVGCQLKTTGQRAGVGVVGVIECNFLKPAHNKQDFEYTKEYRLTLGALGLKLNDYCKEMTEKKAREREIHALKGGGENEGTRDADQGPMWLQCEECLKWRSVPAGHYSVTPESWTCSQNPNRFHRSCSSPEESEESEELLTPSYQKNPKKQEHPRSRKREKSPELREPQQQAAKHRVLSRSSARPDRPTLPSTSAPQPAAAAAARLAGHDARDDDDDDDTRAAVPAGATRGEPVAPDALAEDVEDVEDEHGDGAQHTSPEPLGTDGSSVDRLRIKRKSASLYYCVKKRPCILEERQPGAAEPADECHPEGLTNTPEAASPEKTGRDGSREEERAGGAVQQTPAVASQPAEGSEREARVRRLAELEKEARRLRELLGLQVVTGGAEGPQDRPATPPPAAETRDVGCQTTVAEGATVQGPDAERGLKEPPELNGTGKEKSGTRVSGSESCGHEDSRSAEENLRGIRNNVVTLLTTLLPQLDLTGISYETPDVDSILQQIIEVNSLRL